MSLDSRKHLFELTSVSNRDHGRHAAERYQNRPNSICSRSVQIERPLSLFVTVKRVQYRSSFLAASQIPDAF